VQPAPDRLENRSCLTELSGFSEDLPMRSPWRLTLHHYAQNAVDAHLVTLAMALEPIEHVRTGESSIAFSPGLGRSCLLAGENGGS